MERIWKERMLRMSLSRFVLIILVVAAASIVGTIAYYKSTGNNSQDTTQPGANPPLPIASSPGTASLTFEGTLPCADCTGIQTQLSLQKNIDDPSEGVYYLYQTYTGKNDRPVVILGKWDVEKGTPQNTGAVIINLKSGQAQPQYWIVVDNDTIQLLNDQKNQHDVPQNWELKRKP